MHNAPAAFGDSGSTLSLACLRELSEGWLLDGDLANATERTLDARRYVLGHLFWFLEAKGLDAFGPAEAKRFLLYLRRGHEEPGGRWGDPRMTAPYRPASIHLHYRNLHTFCAWLVAQEAVTTSPLARVPAPELPKDQIQPFTPEQVEALRGAAARSPMRTRNVAIVELLLDTGIRASELCGLQVEDVDLGQQQCVVEGKGNKRRLLSMGKRATKALWTYRHEESPSPGGPLFLNQRDEALTDSGLRQLIERLGHAARLQSVRCSPHTFRHTFAVFYLRSGGDVFSLKAMLGHESLAITNRYVALAQADITSQHRRFSPADQMGKRLR